MVYMIMTLVILKEAVCILLLLHMLILNLHMCVRFLQTRCRQTSRCLQTILLDPEAPHSTRVGEAAHFKGHFPTYGLTPGQSSHHHSQPAELCPPG
jgi:hypothetical protein